MRGSGACLGVSRLHERVSRQIFQPLFPRWPERRGSRGPRHQWRPYADLGFWPRRIGCGPKPAARTVGGLRRTTLPDQIAVRFRRGHLGDARRRAARTSSVGSAGASPFSCAREGSIPRRSSAAENVSGSQCPHLGLRPQVHRLQAAQPPAARSRAVGAIAARRAPPIQIVVAGKAHPADEIGQGHDPGMDHPARGSRAFGATSCFSKTTTSRSPRSSSRASTSGSTRRAGRGRPAAPAA